MKQTILLAIGIMVVAAVLGGGVGADEEAPLPPEGGFVPGEVIVRFSDDLQEPADRLLEEGRPFRGAITDGSDSLDRLMKEHKVQRGRAVFRQTGNNSGARNVYVLELDAGMDVASAAAAFADDPHVEYAQPNYLVQAQFTPDDPYLQSSGSWGQPYDDLWGLKIIDAEGAWDVTQGAGVVVAVVDTGLDYNHPDIAANVWTNTDEIPGNDIDDDLNGYVDDVQGWDFVAYDDGMDDNDPMDGNGHGTHVSGTIAAVGNNGIGIVGVAPEAQIMALKGLDDNGSGSSADLARALEYAADNGADVINNSWSCSVPCPENSVLEDAVSYAHGLGSVIVFAAGNSHNDVALFSPQNQPETISVGAVNEQDIYNPQWGYGAALDVLAPGNGTNVSPPAYKPKQAVLSLLSAAASPDPDLIVGSEYYRLRGTSMATPHVSGAAALVLAANPAFTNEQVRQALRISADDLEDAGFDLKTGAGRINVAQAVAVDSALGVMITSPRHGSDVTATSELEIRGTVTGADLASYQLSYTTGWSNQPPWEVDDPASWTLISAGGSAEFVDELLGTLDTDALDVGKYTILLEATDTDGTVFEARAMFYKELTDLPFQIAFESGRDSYQGVYTLDGGAAVRLPVLFARAPSWSPDATKFVFHGSAATGSEIFTVNADGSDLEQLTFTPGLFSRTKDPVWSPDGSRIAYEKTLGSSENVWVMDADGSNQTQLIDDEVSDFSPAWSPDGSKLAFQRAGSGVVIVNADGTGETELTIIVSNVEVSTVSDLDWSPDGLQIALAGIVSYQSDIVVANVDGSGSYSVSNYSTEYETEPSWSSDGEWIAFKRNINHDLWMIRPDGTDLTRITANPADDMSADWLPGPLPPATPTVTATATPTGTVTPTSTITPTSTPTPTITLTPTPTTTTQPEPGDTDGDGCSDQQENGPDETIGGLRNYKNPWDFYDVLGGGGGQPDGIVDLPNDILGVIQHFSPSGAPPYDAQFDRGPSTGPNAWNMAKPDGAIDLPNDILGVIKQYNHNCT